MKTKCIILSLAIVLICTLYVSSEESFYGRWKINTIITTPGISALNQEEAESVLGKTLYLSPEDAIFDNNFTCKNPIYEKRRLTESEFFSESWLNFKDLNITGDSVIEITIYDDKGKEWEQILGRWFLIKDKDTLVTGWDGVYYELTRDSTSSHK